MAGQGVQPVFCRHGPAGNHKLGSEIRVQNRRVCLKGQLCFGAVKKRGLCYRIGYGRSRLGLPGIVEYRGVAFLEANAVGTVPSDVHE